MRHRILVEVVVDADTHAAAVEVIENELGMCCLGREDEEEDYVSEPHIVTFDITGTRPV